MVKSTQPVLVTGSNRSGTTWLGRMLCQSRELYYLHEPFNPSKWPRFFADPIPQRNLYVTVENESRYLEAGRAIAHGAFPVAANLREVRSARRAAKFAREYARRWGWQVSRRAPLVKDPIAVFSAEWLARRFDMRVVVAIRNPVAYAGSVKRLDWRFDFTNWIAQPLLMRDLLGPYEDEIGRIASSEHDIVDEAILQWNCHYHVIAGYRDRNVDWIFVDHDVVAESPVAAFERLYSTLGLRFDERTKRGIERFTSPDNATDAPPGERGPIRRDSRAARHTWRTRLTDDEVERVRDGTRDVAARFYDAGAEWLA